MDYIVPLNGDLSDPNRSYVDAVPENGIQGSRPSGKVFEIVQREILEVIDQAGLERDANSTTQLYEGISLIIQNAIPTLSLQRLEIVLVAADFAVGVTDGKVVYKDNGTGKFTLAQAGPDTPFGIADVTNNKVYISGSLPTNLLTGLTAGATYYLSDTVAGEITTTPPANAVKIGRALSATDFFLDINNIVSGAATTTQRGNVELATDAETIDGTDNERAVTPEGLTAWEASRNRVFSDDNISGDMSIVLNSQSVFAHGLGVVPKIVLVWLKCVSAEHGYQPLDLALHQYSGDGGREGFGVRVDGTNIHIYTADRASVLADNNGGEPPTITPAKWKYKIYAAA